MGEFTVVLPILAPIYSCVYRSPLRCTFAILCLCIVLDCLSQYSTEGKVKEPNLLADAGRDIISAVTSYARHDMGGALRSAMDLVKTASGSANAQKAEQISKATRTSPADVVRNQVDCLLSMFFFKKLDNIFLDFLEWL